MVFIYDKSPLLEFQDGTYRVIKINYHPFPLKYLEHLSTYSEYTVLSQSPEFMMFGFSSEDFEHAAMVRSRFRSNAEQNPRLGLHKTHLGGARNCHLYNPNGKNVH